MGKINFIGIGSVNILASLMNFVYLGLLISSISPKDFNTYVYFLLFYNIFFYHINQVGASSKLKNAFSIEFLIVTYSAAMLISSIYVVMISDDYIFPIYILFFTFSAMTWFLHEAELRKKEAFRSIVNSRLISISCTATLFWLIWSIDYLSIEVFIVLRGVEFWISKLSSSNSDKGLHNELVSEYMPKNRSLFLFYFAYLLTTLPANIDKLIYSLKFASTENSSVFNQLAVATLVLPGRIFEAFITVFLGGMLNGTVSTKNLKPMQILFIYFTFLATSFSLHMILFGWVDLLLICLAVLQSLVFYMGQLKIYQVFTNQSLNSKTLWLVFLLTGTFISILLLIPTEAISHYIILSCIFNITVILIMRREI